MAMMIPMQDVPRKIVTRSQEINAIIADVTEMLEKRVKAAEIVPLNPEKYDKNPGVFTEKLRRVCRHCSKTEDWTTFAACTVQMRRDMERKPHWYVTAAYVEEDIDPNCRECIAAGR